MYVMYSVTDSSWGGNNIEREVTRKGHMETMHGISPSPPAPTVGQLLNGSRTIGWVCRRRRAHGKRDTPTSLGERRCRAKRRGRCLRCRGTGCTECESTGGARGLWKTSIDSSRRRRLASEGKRIRRRSHRRGCRIEREWGCRLTKRRWTGGLRIGSG